MSIQAVVETPFLSATSKPPGVLQGHPRPASNQQRFWPTLRLSGWRSQHPAAFVPHTPLNGDVLPPDGATGPGHFALGIEAEMRDAWRKGLPESGMAQRGSVPRFP
jgi:hypothetical protein